MKFCRTLESQEKVLMSIKFLNLFTFRTHTYVMNFKVNLSVKEINCSKWHYNFCFTMLVVNNFFKYCHRTYKRIILKNQQ